MTANKDNSTEKKAISPYQKSPHIAGRQNKLY